MSGTRCGCRRRHLASVDLRTWIAFGQLLAVPLITIAAARTSEAGVGHSGPVYIKISDLQGPANVDIDHDGTTDFVLAYINDQGLSELRIAGEQPDPVGPRNAVASINYGCAIGPPMLLGLGDLIDTELPPKGIWSDSAGGGILAMYNGSFWGGQFLGTRGYIGVRFYVGQESHFGWIDFEADAHATEGTIRGWAYESTPDMPLHAGDKGPPGDFDLDGDVDEQDLNLFTCCVTGPFVAYDPCDLPTSCALTHDGEGHVAADFDRDGDVDQEDFGVLQRCYSGEGNPADPNCAN